MRTFLIILRLPILAFLIATVACAQDQIVEVSSSRNVAPQSPKLLVEETPRTALVSAFGLESDVYLANMTDKQVFTINGLRFTTGELRGQQVVVVLTNVSIPNAVMVTQLLLDHFNIERIIASGIAGGVNPDLNIGDVVISERWALYQEMYFQRRNDNQLPEYLVPNAAQVGLDLAEIHGESGSEAMNNFGFMFTRTTTITSASDPQFPDADSLGFPNSSNTFWFPVDPSMLQVAQSIRDQIDLMDCATPQTAAAEICVSDETGRQPRLLVDGNGVSGPTFVDNAQYRQYVFDTFTVEDGSLDRVNVLDMETAGVAFVASANDTPFIAVRTISDLAGADPSFNVLPIFAGLAINNTSATVLKLLEGLQ